MKPNIDVVHIITVVEKRSFQAKNTFKTANLLMAARFPIFFIFPSSTSQPHYTLHRIIDAGQPCY